ncbi:rod-binding protein [Planctomyces sp. SH-PL14]|uniref:rod-binding protein n=1 Tax=Planctomyces sp. SH-PL14 TaxID=1632864 RepID=UPI00078C329C|nr:rod-binding protein [Planctomyces sp. SH-PL14]AMV21581.1 Peptidoglycan hydrolase FlgJ [Planctomyces sp. SH-PL14]
MNPLSSVLPAGSYDAGLGLSGKSETEAAKQLESLFVSLLLKEMRQTIGSEDGFAGDKSDTIGGLFDQYMGEHMAAGGGLGIADSLRGALLRDAGGAGVGGSGT